jgi:hypothetical protein
MILSLTYAATVGNCSGMVIVTVCAERDRGLTERLPYHRMKSILASRAGDGQTFSNLVMEGLSLALIGNASAQKFPGRRAGPEAFSKRRQVGSRWRSRRTRLAMGFEWRFS